MPDERCARLGSLGCSRAGRRGVTRFPRPQPCCIPCSPARSSPCDRLASAGIGASNQAASGVLLSLGHGFYHLSCCSTAPRCPWNVHGSQGLSLYALCVFGCDLGDGWSCLLLPWLRTVSRFDRILHLLACLRLCHCSLLLERTWKAMLDTSMRIHVRVTLECLLGIVVHLFESPTVVGTADVAQSRTRES
jgi:hypothetical protein